MEVKGDQTRQRVRGEKRLQILKTYTPFFLEGLAFHANDGKNRRIETKIIETRIAYTIEIKHIT